jgi:hypothetical protein
MQRQEGRGKMLVRHNCYLIRCSFWFAMSTKAGKTCIISGLTPQWLMDHQGG